jgi:hypothetical protein
MERRTQEDLDDCFEQGGFYVCESIITVELERAYSTGRGRHYDG